MKHQKTAAATSQPLPPSSSNSNSSRRLPPPSSPLPAAKVYNNRLPRSSQRARRGPKHRRSSRPRPSLNRCTASLPLRLRQPPPTTRRRRRRRGGGGRGHRPGGDAELSGWSAGGQSGGGGECTHDRSASRCRRGAEPWRARWRRRRGWPKRRCRRSDRPFAAAVRPAARCRRAASAGAAPGGWGVGTAGAATPVLLRCRPAAKPGLPAGPPSAREAVAKAPTTIVRPADGEGPRQGAPSGGGGGGSQGADVSAPAVHWRRQHGGGAEPNCGRRRVGGGAGQAPLVGGGG